MSATQTIELTHRHVSSSAAAHSTSSSLRSEEHGGISLSDPLSLKEKKITHDYIHNQLKGQKKLQKFYLNQNEQIDNMLSALDNIDEEEEQRQLLKVKYKKKEN